MNLLGRIFEKLTFHTVWRLVRCCMGSEERPMGSLAQGARAYGQVRGVIPFSCAYFAADASTMDRTSA